MDADEKVICLYLKSCPDAWMATREISRRAGGKRRFRDEPGWVSPVLIRLVEQGIIESDSTGHYRLVPRIKNKKDKSKKWISPQMRQILQRSGKDFSGTIQIEDDDDFEAI